MLKLATKTEVVLVGVGRGPPVVGVAGTKVVEKTTGVVGATKDGSHRFPRQQATSQEAINPVMFIMSHTAKKIKRH